MATGRYQINVTYSLIFLRDSEAVPTKQWIRDSFAGDIEGRFAFGVDGFEDASMVISDPEQLPYDPPPEC